MMIKKHTKNNLNIVSSYNCNYCSILQRHVNVMLLVHGDSHLEHTI